MPAAWMIGSPQAERVTPDGYEREWLWPPEPFDLCQPKCWPPEPPDPGLHYRLRAVPRWAAGVDYVDERIPGYVR